MTKSNITFEYFEKLQEGKHLVEIYEDYSHSNDFDVGQILHLDKQSKNILFKLYDENGFFDGYMIIPLSQVTYFSAHSKYLISLQHKIDLAKKTNLFYFASPNQKIENITDLSFSNVLNILKKTEIIAGLHFIFHADNAIEYGKVQGFSDASITFQVCYHKKLTDTLNIYRLGDLTHIIIGNKYC
ncbi:hypothetical protein FWH30_00690 [Microgenomates group bacterium]|nr:hypothetical protein [Microgenomates group bacterium]